MAHLFTVKIATGGAFECTQPADKVYLLSFASPPDNRLTKAFITSFRLALDIIEHKYPVGVVITTSAIAKFYSNGLDFEVAIKTPGFFGTDLYGMFRRLLTYPMPTIALMNGHAFAGGFMTAMFHDYRFMNPSKGFLCLNELQFGAPMPAGMMAPFRHKIPNPAIFRDLVIEAKRITGPDALKESIVDGLGGLDEVLKFVAERKLTMMGKTGVYRKLKTEMWRDTLALLADHDKNEEWLASYDELYEGTTEAAKKAIAEWEASGSKAKL